MEQSLEKLIVTKLAKKYPVFYATRSFITTITTARHFSLFFVGSNPFFALPFYFTNLHLVLSSHLRLGHPRGLYLSFAYQNPLLLPACHMPRPSHLSWFHCWNYLCATGYNVLCFYAICVSPPRSSLTLSVSLLSTCAIVLAELLVVLPLLEHLNAGPADSNHFAV